MYIYIYIYIFFFFFFFLDQYFIGFGIKYNTYINHRRMLVLLVI